MNGGEYDEFTGGLDVWGGLYKCRYIYCRLTFFIFIILCNNVLA